MGTICEIRALGDDPARASAAISAAFEEIAGLESILSTYRPDSEVSRLNASSATVWPCSPELAEILRRSLELSRATEGAFDITYAGAPRTSFPNVSIGNPGGIPASAGMTAGSKRLRLDASGTLHRSTVETIFNFGGIGKGFALDRAAAVLADRGVENAFLNFGGQALAVGPGPDGQGWPVMVAGSRGPRTILLRDASLATSSQSEQPGHIIDPRTGRAATYAGAVSVLAPTATEADALSTAFFVLGPEPSAAIASARPGITIFFNDKPKEGNKT